MIDMEERNNMPDMKMGCIRKIDEETGRRKWIIDNEIPTFKGDGCKYVNDLIFINE